MARASHFYRVALVVIWMLAAGAGASAQSQTERDEPGRVWGYIFGDYFFKAVGEEATWGSAHYADVEEGMHAGELRRLYLGYDYRLSPRFSSRALLEANHGTTFADGNYGVFVKLGYLSWHDPIETIPLTVNVGLIPTPVFAFPERTWGYRSVEQEAINLRGFGRSVDQGISLTGSFSRGGETGFHVMVGNNSGTRPARNPYKAFYGSLHHRFAAQNLSFEVMGSYLPVGRGDGATRIGRVFAGYEPGPFRLGLELAGVWDENPADVGLPLGTEVTRLVASSFGAVGVSQGAIRVEVFGRYDFYDPDVGFDEAKAYVGPEAFYRQHLLIAGVSVRPHERVHLIPNLWINIYAPRTSATPARDPDVVPRLTFYFVY